MRSRKCRCRKDQDGNCVSCRDRLVNATKFFGTAFRDFLESVERLRKELDQKIGLLKEEFDQKIESLYPEGRALCQRCSIQYADLAMAKMLLTMDGADKKVAEAVLMGMVEKLTTVVKKKPLTERTWSQLCIKNGWKSK